MKNFTLSTLARLLLVAGLLLTFQTSAFAQENEEEMPPPEDTEATVEMEASAETTADSDQTIAAVLEAEGNFSVLLGALKETGLAETLESGESFTVFAPTDDAFAALPAGTLDSLSTDQVAGILSYHVVPGIVDPAEAAEPGILKTAHGAELSVETAADGTVSVNGTPLAASEGIEAENGVVYVIDSVLMPPQDGASGTSSSK